MKHLLKISCNLSLFCSTVAVVLALSITPCLSQVQPSKVKEFLSLTGEIHILNLFVETSNGSWEEDEKDYYSDEMLESQNWIVNQAEAWGKTVEFDNEYFFSDNKSTVYLEHISRRLHPSHTLQLIMEDLGYESIDQFLIDNDFDKTKNKLKVVLFVKSNDRSHAYNYWSIEHIDLAIIFCRSTFGMVTDQYVISHEMLHQFGAWDLYYEKGRNQTKVSSEKAFELYPNSIMINTHKKKKLLEVDAVTAFRVGWAEWNEEYSLFDPAINKEQIEKERAEATEGGIKFKLK